MSCQQNNIIFNNYLVKLRQLVAKFEDCLYYGRNHVKSVVPDIKIPCEKHNYSYNNNQSETLYISILELAVISPIGFGIVPVHCMLSIAVQVWYQYKKTMHSKTCLESAKCDSVSSSSMTECTHH